MKVELHAKAVIRIPTPPHTHASVTVELPLVSRRHQQKQKLQLEFLQ